MTVENSDEPLVEVEEIAALMARLASEECSFFTGAVGDLSG